MNSIPSNTGGTSSSFSSNAAYSFYKQSGETDKTLTSEAHETTAQDEGSTSSNTEQESSNKISLQEELSKAQSNLIDIETRINSLSLLKKKILSGEELNLIKNRLDEAKEKLSTLDNVNQGEKFTKDLKRKGKISSKEEEKKFKELEQQLIDLKNANGNILKFLADIEAYVRPASRLNFCLTGEI